MKDCVRKGRSKNVGQTWLRKLTDAQIIEIREAKATSKVSYRELAERFSVSPDTIYKIVSKRSWREVGTDEL